MVLYFVPKIKLKQFPVHGHLMDQHNVLFFCNFSEDAEVFPEAGVTDWSEASPDPDSTKETTEE